MSAAPLRGGLTQALGGRKTFVFRRRFACMFNRPTHCRVFAVLNCCAHFFRQSFIASERLRGALKLRRRYVRRHRKRWLAFGELVGSGCSRFGDIGESSQGALGPHRFGFSDALAGLMSRRHPPPPNNSFKPTPCRGVGHALYATLARVRRPATGRLNSGVRLLGEHLGYYRFAEQRLA